MNLSSYREVTETQSVVVLNENTRYAEKVALAGEGVKLFYLSEIGRLSEWLRALRPSPTPQGVDVAA